MLPTLPQSRSSVSYTETPEAKYKVALILTIVQNYLPGQSHVPRTRLEELLSEYDVDVKISYDTVKIANREAWQVHFCISPKDGDLTLCDACVLEFMGVGRTPEEAWEVMVARAKGRML